MKKTLKTILIVVLALVVLGGAITGYLLWRNSRMYVGADAAKAAALADAGFDNTQVYQLHADLEQEHGDAFYEVEFIAEQTEYDYIVDAASGQVLSSWTEPVHHD